GRLAADAVGAEAGLALGAAGAGLAKAAHPAAAVHARAGRDTVGVRLAHQRARVALAHRRGAVDGRAEHAGAVTVAGRGGGEGAVLAGGGPADRAGRRPGAAAGAVALAVH